jgi:hypothetical protein
VQQVDDGTKKIIGIVNTRDDLAGILRDSRFGADNGSEHLIVAGDGGLAEAVPTHIPVQLLSHYAPAGDIQREAVQWIDEWSDRSVLGGASLKEQLAYEDVSLWWFFLPVLFPDVMRCMQYVNSYINLFAAEAPTSVVCPDVRSRPMLPFRLNRSFDLQTRVAAMVAESMGLPLRAPAASRRGQWNFWSTYLRRSATANLYGTLGRDMDRLGRKALSGIARLTVARRAVEGNGRRLLLFSTPVYWRQEDVSPVAPGGRDVIAGRTVDELVGGSGWQVVDIDAEVNIPCLEHYRRLWQKIRRPDVECVPLECFFDREVRRAVAVAGVPLGKLWQRLSGDGDFKDSLCYRGVSLWPLLRGRLDYLFCEYAHVAFAHIIGVDRLIATEKPDAVLIEYEEGSYGRAATVAARKRSVPSVALQHGMHGGAYIPAYYFRKTAWDQPGSLDACPVPTKTAVFGDVTRRYLTEVSSYPADAVEVTGTTIYDQALAFGGKVDKGTVRARLGLVERQTATVLSSIFIEAQDRRWFIEKTLGAITDSRMACIVKLHPREDAGAWSDAATSMGVEQPILFKDGLWQAIAAADVVVSWYSTTILDALLLGRPVVVLRIPGKNNPESLAGTGGIQIADDRVELAAALVRIARETECEAGPSDQARRLLQDHLYKCDGKARERIAALLDEVVDTARRGAVVDKGSIGDEELIHGV